MNDTAGLSFEQRLADDVLVVSVSGSLVADAGCRRMRQETEKLLATGVRKLLLNLQGIQFMDSTGVGVLLAAKTSAINRGIRLKVCCLPPFIARLLAQLHLSRILEVYDQEAAALESFRQPPS